jgi:Spy/CpxP family protein refolding chaperone
MRRMATLLVALALSLAAPAGAAPRPASAVPPPPPASAAVADSKKPGELRKEVLERMRAQRAWRIVEELKLDETTSARLFPILSRYDEQEMALATERRDITRELQALLAAPHPDDARITAAVNRMLANRTKRHAFKDERVRELRKVLTPVQQGKLVLLLPRLEREFATFIQDAAGGHRDDAP